MAPAKESRTMHLRWYSFFCCSNHSGSSDRFQDFIAFPRDTAAVLQMAIVLDPNHGNHLPVKAAHRLSTLQPPTSQSSTPSHTYFDVVVALFAPDLSNCWWQKSYLCDRPSVRHNLLGDGVIQASSQQCINY